MLPPPKKRKFYDASIVAEDEAEDDLDESKEAKPDWHASFNVQSRTALISDEAWMREAVDVSTKLRARELKHVMWWDTQAINPKWEALYALPHLNYTHDTGVVEFSVSPACCQRLASFLDEPSSSPGDSTSLTCDSMYRFRLVRCAPGPVAPRSGISARVVTFHA